MENKMTFRELLKQDVFATHLGVELMEIERERVRATLKVSAEHLNAGGVCQGGVLFGMADLVFAAVTNYSRKLTFTISSSITFHKSALLGDRLEAIGIPVCAHHKVPCCEVKIFNQSGELLASFSGVGYSKNISLPFEKIG